MLRRCAGNGLSLSLLRRGRGASAPGLRRRGRGGAGTVPVTSARPPQGLAPAAPPGPAATTERRQAPGKARWGQEH